MMNSNQWKATGLAVLLFAIGVATGVLGHRYYNSTVSAKTAEDFRQKYVGEMQTRLHLTPHQVDQLQVILDETRAEFRAVRERSHPEMETVKNGQIQRVKAILTPQQMDEYARMISEREEQAKQKDQHDREEEARQAAAHLKTLNGDNKR